MFPTHAASCEALAWHPNCLYLLVGTQGGPLRLFDVQSGTPLRVLVGHTTPICALATSPCGGMVYSADAQGCVRGWDLEEGVCIGAEWVEGVEGSETKGLASALGRARVSGLAVSPSSRVVAVVGTDSRLTLLDARAWKARSSRLRALHSPSVRTEEVVASKQGSNDAAMNGSGTASSGDHVRRLPTSVITAEPEVEEAAFAEAAAAAVARASREASLGSAVAESVPEQIAPVRFCVLYGKATRFYHAAFSRDGALAVAGVFDPPQAE